MMKPWGAQSTCPLREPCKPLFMHSILSFPTPHSQSRSVASSPLVPTLKPIGPNPQTHWSQPSNPSVPAQPANTLVGTLDGLVCRSGKLHRLKLQRLKVGASLRAGERGRG